MPFINIEGPNGAGKSTILKKLAAKGYKTLISPGGTELGQYLRPVCRGTDQWKDLDKVVKFLCFSAARYDEYLKLVHGRDEIIITDRWHFSTYVYQVCLEGIPESFYRATIHPDEKIDLVIILSGSFDVLLKRMEDERKINVAHGKCTWTQNIDTMKEIHRLYSVELPTYLSEHKIPYLYLNTDNYTIDQVVEQIEPCLKIK